MPQSCFVLMTSLPQDDSAHLKQTITSWLAGRWKSFQLLSFSIMNLKILQWHFEGKYWIMIKFFCWNNTELLHVSQSAFFWWECIVLIICLWIVPSLCIRRFKSFQHKCILSQWDDGWARSLYGSRVVWNSRTICGRTKATLTVCGWGRTLSALFTQDLQLEIILNIQRSCISCCMLMKNCHFGSTVFCSFPPQRLFWSRDSTGMK